MNPLGNVNTFLRKRKTFRTIEALYGDLCCDLDDFTTQAIELSDWNAIIDDLIKKMHQKKLEPSDLSQEYVLKTYRELQKAAAKGYQKNWVVYHPKTGIDKTVLALKKNLFQFSCAKTLAHLEQMNGYLYDKSGRIKPYSEFERLAKKSAVRYNKNYLQVEYQTALTGANAIRKWEEFQTSKHIFANLVYRTVGDGRVRLDHELLNGTVKPIDDPFWRSYYPPNGWRCRCYVVPTAEEVTPKEVEDPTVRPEFKGNVALDNEIFTSKGSFFKLLKQDPPAQRNAALLKLNAPYQEVYKKGTKKVWVNDFADPKDLEQNIEVAKIMVQQLKVDVYIRPHLDGMIMKDFKNPEYLIENKKADLKIPESKNYKNSLRKANVQECQVVVYDLRKNQDSLESCRHKINDILKYKGVHSHIKEIIIITSMGEVKKYDRKTIGER